MGPVSLSESQLQDSFQVDWEQQDALRDTMPELRPETEYRHALLSLFQWMNSSSTE